MIRERKLIFYRVLQHLGLSNLVLFLAVFNSQYHIYVSVMREKCVLRFNLPFRVQKCVLGGLYKLKT